jgi:hypothetical protein
MRYNSLFFAICVVLGGGLLPSSVCAQNTATLPPSALNGSGNLQWQWHPVQPLGPYKPIEARVTKELRIQKSFVLGTGFEERRVEVDNFTGSIEITGTASDGVKLVVLQTFRAESQEALDKSQQEVRLDIAQDRGVLKLAVNGPFRCEQSCAGLEQHTGYSVKMDFQLQVPEQTAIKLNTVNEGHILVTNVRGHYEVRNVNGDIDMRDIAGSGMIRAVNGGVRVSFLENPQKSSSFGSVNGNVDLYFTKDLSADFDLKTFNGGVRSDFSMNSIPPSNQLQDGKLVLSSDRYTAARVGSGGPQIQVDTLNGNIHILERHD